MRRVLRVPVETGDTEPEHKSVQLSAVSFVFMNTSSGYTVVKRKEGGYPGYRMEVADH